jgi:hypothetical protein
MMKGELNCLAVQGYLLAPVQQNNKVITCAGCCCCCCPAAAANSQEGTRVTGQPVPGECEACFDSLTANQKSGFDELLPNHFPGITTIEQLCTFLRNQVFSGQDPTESISTVGDILDIVGVNQNTISSITSCMLRAVE